MPPPDNEWHALLKYFRKVCLATYAAAPCPGQGRFVCYSHKCVTSQASDMRESIRMLRNHDANARGITSTAVDGAERGNGPLTVAGCLVRDLQRGGDRQVGAVAAAGAVAECALPLLVQLVLLLAAQLRG